MIRVLLVDDHPLVASGLQAALSAVPDIDVIGAVSTVSEAKSVIGREAVDVAIVDIRLGDGSGLELLGTGTAGGRTTLYLILSSFDSAQYVDAALRLGASGFLVKTAPTGEIIAAIRRVAAGGSAFEGRALSSLPGGRWRPLSPRDREIVAGVVRGRTNDEIGRDLGISRKTVEAHLSRMFDRFEVPTRTDLAVRAERERWLDMPPHTGRSLSSKGDS